MFRLQAQQELRIFLDESTNTYYCLGICHVINNEYQFYYLNSEGNSFKICIDFDLIRTKNPIIRRALNKVLIHFEPILNTAKSHVYTALTDNELDRFFNCAQNIYLHDNDDKLSLIRLVSTYPINILACTNPNKKISK